MTIVVLILSVVCLGILSPILFGCLYVFGACVKWLTWKVIGNIFSFILDWSYRLYTLGGRIYEDCE